MNNNNNEGQLNLNAGLPYIWNTYVIPDLLAICHQGWPVGYYACECLQSTSLHPYNIARARQFRSYYRQLKRQFCADWTTFHLLSYLDYECCNGCRGIKLMNIQEYFRD